MSHAWSSNLGSVTTMAGFFCCSALHAADTPTVNELANGRFVDAHVHFHHVKESSMDEVAAWMKQHNIRRVINHELRPMRPKDEAQRKQMLKNYAKYKGAIERFTIIEPQEVSTVEEAVKILEREKADGAIGFGEHYGRGLQFDDPSNMRLFAACEKVGLPVMFHMDRDKNLDSKGLPGVKKALESYPTVTFIAHSGGFWKHVGDGTVSEMLKKYPNLYADISCTAGRGSFGKDTTFAKHFYQKHQDKLLFGSDCGWWSFREGLKPEYAYIDTLDLPKDVEEKILRGNAAKLFPIKK